MGFTLIENPDQGPYCGRSSGTFNMHAKLVVAAVTAALAICVSPGRAEVNEQCAETWEQVVSAELIGTSCKWIDNASRQKLQATESRNLACAVSNVTGEEKTLFDAKIAEARTRLASSLRNAPCNPSARRFFDAQVAR
jgi:hypothetical protein